MDTRSLPLLLAVALGCATTPPNSPAILDSGLRQVHVAVDRIE